jgi:hypothetical protein
VAAIHARRRRGSLVDDRPVGSELAMNDWPRWHDKAAPYILGAATLALFIYVAIYLSAKN